MSTFVRPYEAKDREALLQIGAETAFFGAPIERYMEDRRIFMDAFYAYYTDYEPEHAWVACASEQGIGGQALANQGAGDQVVGFLTGCVDSQAHDRIFLRKIFPSVFWKFVRGYYHPGPRLWAYVRAGAGAARRGEIPGADYHLYPAHLHINLLPDWRGCGLGRGLMDAYLNQLRNLAVVGVHLQTTSMNAVACRLYEKVGFHLLGACLTRMYSHLVDQPVEHRCYGLKLK